ncbi:hypothetical protein P5F11_15085 [Clostridium perfringens]|nr:hypothetical protein [Clostridium perfringens]
MNNLVDNWNGPLVRDIDKCHIECFINRNRDVEFTNNFEKAYREYLREIGIRDTKDFQTISKVVPELVSSFLYDTKNKKVLKLYSFKKNLTKDIIEKLMDKFDDGSENWYEFFEILDDLGCFEGKEVFDIDIDLCRKLESYKYMNYVDYRNILIDYTFDISEYNTDDLLEPDFPFERIHIGIGTKYKPLDKNAKDFCILESGKLINSDDDGEEAIFVHIDLEELSGRTVY